MTTMNAALRTKTKIQSKQNEWQPDYRLIYNMITTGQSSKQISVFLEPAMSGQGLESIAHRGKSLLNYKNIPHFEIFIYKKVNAFKKILKKNILKMCIVIRHIF